MELKKICRGVEGESDRQNREPCTVCRRFTQIKISLVAIQCVKSVLII